MIKSSSTKDKKRTRHNMTKRLTLEILINDYQNELKQLKQQLLKEVNINDIETIQQLLTEIRGFEIALYDAKKSLKTTY